VTPQEKLMFAYALDGGAWTSFRPLEGVDLSSYDFDNLTIDAKVRDEEGNVGHARLKRENGQSELMEPAVFDQQGEPLEWREVVGNTAVGFTYGAEPQGGCSASGQNAGGGAVAFLLGLMLLLRGK
jgi:hypothetical protein